MARSPLASEDMIDSDEAFGQTYQTHAQPIYRFFYWRTQAVELSKDLTSRVFEKAWQARHSFSRGSVRAWLYRIARNLLIDHWRTNQALPLTDQDMVISPVEDVSEALDKRLAAEHLHQVLAQLPTDMKAVVELRFMQGLSSLQVANRLHLSASNVRVIQYRALKKLRQYLDE